MSDYEAIFELVEKNARATVERLIAEATNEAGEFDGADFQARLAAMVLEIQRATQ